MITKLNRTPFRKFGDVFASLAIPTTVSLPGRYRGAFVGPAWLRTAAGPALAITGLGGWWGKEIFADGTAINIVLRAGNYSLRFPMKFVERRSSIDSRQGLALRYQAGNPFPWPLIVDEIRRLDEITLLGMTLVDVRWLRRLAFPFILQKQA